MTALMDAIREAASVPWQARAACRGMDPDIFFPARGDYHGQRAAKAICQGCEVREPCLEVGLSLAHGGGVWGGTVERQRVRIREQRRLAREGNK